MTQGTISLPVALALDAAPLHRRALALAFAQGAGEARLGRLVRHAVARTGAVGRALELVEGELAAVTRAVLAMAATPARDALVAVCTAMGLRAR